MKRFLAILFLAVSAYGQGTLPPVYFLYELGDTSIVSPSNGQVLTWDGTSSLWKNMTPSVGVSSVVGAIGFTADGGGSVVTTGIQGYFTVPYTGTITGWSITADGASPTCTIDVWKRATGTVLPTVANTIMGTKPALSTGNAKRSTTMTGWTTSFTAGDIFGFNIDAATVATKLTFTLETSH
jgi:hypothetical protein